MARKDGKTSRDRGLFQRDGVWWILYYENGRRHREKIGPSKSAAREAYQKRKTQIREEKFFPEDVTRRKRPLMSVLIADYLEESKATKRSWREDVRYARIWTEAVGNLMVDEVKPADVERVRREAARRLSPQSVIHQLNFLKRVFSIAIRDGLCERNPVSQVKTAPANNSRIRYLTDDEEARLREVVPAWAWPIVALAFLTGMRRGELFGLRWNCVDLVRKVATIPRSKHGEKRHVRLNGEAVEILRDLPSRLKADWVFPSKTGTHMDGHNFVNRVFIPAVRAAKIPDFRFHDLRHTFCSRLVMDGVPLHTVRELAGHKTIRMTERYAHLAPDHLAAAVEVLSHRSASNRTATGTATGQEQPLAT